MAGIDGIKNKTEPPDPIDKDLYDLPPEEHATVKQVPGSLLEVLGELEADHQWLLEGGVFTQDVIDTWIEYKRIEEHDAVRPAAAPVRVRPVLRRLREPRRPAASPGTTRRSDGVPHGSEPAAGSRADPGRA